MTTEIRRLPHRPRFGFGQLAAAILELDRIHRQRADLAELDDRILRDIGLHRADVDAELRRPVRAFELLWHRTAI